MHTHIQQQLAEIHVAGYQAQLTTVADSATMTITLAEFPHEDFVAAEVQWLCSSHYPRQKPHLHISVTRLSEHGEVERVAVPMRLPELEQWDATIPLLTLTRMVEAQLQVGMPLTATTEPSRTHSQDRLPVPEIPPYPQRPQPVPRPPTPRPFPSTPNLVPFVTAGASLVIVLGLVSFIALISSPPPPPSTTELAQRDAHTIGGQTASPTTPTTAIVSGSGSQNSNTSVTPIPRGVPVIPAVDTRTIEHDFRALWQTYESAVATAQQQQDAASWNAVVEATDGLIAFWDANEIYREALLRVDSRTNQLIDIRGNTRIIYVQNLVQEGLFDAAFAQYDTVLEETNNPDIRREATRARSIAAATLSLWQGASAGLATQSWEMTRSNLDLLESQIEAASQACAPRTSTNEPCQRINDFRQVARQAEEEQRRAELAREQTATALAQQYRLPTFIEIPAGSFTMGSADTDIYARPDEQPQRTIDVPRFWIAHTETTNEQFRLFIEAGGYNQSNYWTENGWRWRTENGITSPRCWNDRLFNQPRQPVVCISWYEARAYTAWLRAATGMAYYLPSEIEWEKAARGTDSRLYPWGNEDPDPSRAIYKSGEQVLQPVEVGRYPSGASPYGVLDMGGNVWEFTRSQYDETAYTRAYQIEDPAANAGITPNQRIVIRGGSWNNQAPVLRTTTRDKVQAFSHYDGVGFRLVWYP